MPSWAKGSSFGKFGGPGRDRTDDLFHAMEARSQLRHRPIRTGADYSYARALVSQTSLAEKRFTSSGSHTQWQQFAKAVKMGMLSRRRHNMNCRYLAAVLALLM